MKRKARTLMNWAQAVEQMMVGGVMRRQSDKRGEYQDITMIGPVWDEEQFGYWFASFPGLEMFAPDNECLRATDWYVMTGPTKIHIWHKREICEEFGRGDLIESGDQWPEWPEQDDEILPKEDVLRFLRETRVEVKAERELSLSEAASPHPAASRG